MVACTSACIPFQGQLEGGAGTPEGTDPSGARVGAPMSAPPAGWVKGGPKAPGVPSCTDADPAGGVKEGPKAPRLTPCMGQDPAWVRGGAKAPRVAPPRGADPVVGRGGCKGPVEVRLSSCWGSDPGRRGNPSPLLASKLNPCRAADLEGGAEQGGSCTPA